MLKVQITGLHLRLSKSNSLEDKTQGSASSQGSSVMMCVWVLKLGNHCKANLDNFLKLAVFSFLVLLCGLQGLGSPDQGSNAGPLQWKHRVLTAGLPGKSLN